MSFVLNVAGGLNLMREICGKTVDNQTITHENIWNDIKQFLRQTLPGHAFSTWFAPIVPIALTDDELILEVPNQFFFEWIDSHYKSLIDQAMGKSLLPELKIKYTISPDNGKIGVGDARTVAAFRPKQPPEPPQLNARYNFPSFIEGSNNQFARAAAKSVAENPGQPNFNPLVIYGGVGLGKTHLMHAIGNQILQDHPTLKLICASSEKFTLDFISSIQKNNTVEFSKKYRRTDVLLIDDIQFFQNKEQTQEQFFHTFNELYQSGKQIVLTADRYPGEMSGLQDRLLSRFRSGLAVDIQPPDFEVRVAILMEKAEQNGLDLPYDIIEFMATHIKNNIRELESTIIRILAHSSLTNREIDMSIVKQAVKDRLGKQFVTELTIEDIIKRVSEATNLSERDLVGTCRKKPLVEARQVAVYLSREILGTPLMELGLHFGGRDHTTILHACRSIDRRLKNETRIKQLVTKLKQELTFPLT
ncbi:MAG: chromosomal replication initiator protein DnaA [Candidatus Neomarinimicrobiota bacterium]